MVKTDKSAAEAAIAALQESKGSLEGEVSSLSEGLAASTVEVESLRAALTTVQEERNAARDALIEREKSVLASQAFLDQQLEQLNSAVLKSRIAQLERELVNAGEKFQQTAESLSMKEAEWRKAMEEASDKVSLNKGLLLIVHL